MKIAKLLLSPVALFVPLAAGAQSNWPDNPAAFDAFLKVETARMAQVVKSARIQVQ